MNNTMLNTAHDTRKDLTALYTKLAKASAAIGSIQKFGENKEQKYVYTTDADVAYAVRRACLDVGLFVGMTSAERLASPDEIVSKHGNKGLREYIKVVVAFVDIETGQGSFVMSIGTGQDYGDKAMAKAITSAVKYAMLKGLSLPTGDDPEANAETDTNPAVTTPKPEASTPTARPDHVALRNFLVLHKIPRATFDRIVSERLKRPGAKITDLNQTQITTVLRVLADELSGTGQSLDEAIEEMPS